MLKLTWVRLPMAAAAFACTAMLLPGQVAAQGIDRQARVWAASCAACHGTGGQSQGGIPPIGRDADAESKTRTLAPGLALPGGGCSLILSSFPPEYSATRVSNPPRGREVTETESGSEGEAEEASDERG